MGQICWVQQAPSSLARESPKNEDRIALNVASNEKLTENEHSEEGDDPDFETKIRTARVFPDLII